MYDIMQEIVSSFTSALVSGFETEFPDSSEHSQCLRHCAQSACELLANTDAAYHDIDHSIRVTMVGQEILRGRQVMEGPIDADTWLNVTVALLLHDIGYIRGVCQDDSDEESRYITGVAGESVVAPEGATDAFLTPYHVDRGKVVVRERFTNHPLLNVDNICDNIERTRFPVPNDEDSKATDDYPGLVRAADLIGQLSDPRYPQKQSALYYEFVETGTAEILGYKSAADLRKHYPNFYWGSVDKYVGAGVELLRKTQAGQQIVANLFAHVFSEEHHEPMYGPERLPES